MVAGQGSKDQAAARRLAFGDPAAFQAIVDAIVELTVTYLAGQIENGVDAVQLFNSWAGSLSPAQYEQWVIAPNAEIVRRLKALHPDTPVIGFTKAAGGKLRPYADQKIGRASGREEVVQYG